MLKSNIKRTSTMMKRLFPTALAVLLLLLAGCTAKPDTSNQSKPAEYYLTDTDLPLDDAARLRAAPDFLTAEQQTLYRQAFALYSAMFDGETTGIDDVSQKRAIAAMPIAGGFRAIDFALSNMTNSSIQKVAVLTQYNARSLNEHLSSSKWWDFGRKQGVIRKK